MADQWKLAIILVPSYDNISELAVYAEPKVYPSEFFVFQKKGNVFGTTEKH